MEPAPNSWQTFLATPHLGDYLSLVGLALTLLGFAFTIFAVFRAKSAAEAAQVAAEAATTAVRKIDLVAEMATVLQLVEELKRLHRSRTVDLLPERYSGLRSRVIAIRESKLLGGDEEQTLVQDVVARISALEKAIDANPDLLNSTRQIARSNESLSICMESVQKISQRIKDKIR